MLRLLKRFQVLWQDRTATGAEIESTDKASAVALSAVGVSKLGFLKNAKFVRASIVSTGITDSVTGSAIIQYEKSFQK